MKALKVIRNIIVTILVLAFFTFAIAMTILMLNFNDFGVTQFNDTSLMIIKNEISSDNYEKGDLVVVEAKKIENIQVGEDIFVYKVETNGAASIDVGKVGEVYLEDSAISYENGATYAMKFVAGAPTKTYEDIGSILGIILSKWGFLFIVLVPSFLIFIYEIYAIVVEVKYGKNETKE